MFGPFKVSTLKTVAFVALVAIIVGAGVGQVLKSTVDDLLYWDATAAAESWAKYLAENVTDIEDIADGQPPSAESMAFLIRTQQIRHVFGFEIINLHGDVTCGLRPTVQRSPAFAVPCIVTLPLGPPSWAGRSSR